MVNFFSYLACNRKKNLVICENNSEFVILQVRHSSENSQIPVIYTTMEPHCMRYLLECHGCLYIRNREILCFELAAVLEV